MLRGMWVLFLLSLLISTDAEAARQSGSAKEIRSTEETRICLDLMDLDVPGEEEGQLMELPPLESATKTEPAIEAAPKLKSVPRAEGTSSKADIPAAAASTAPNSVSPLILSLPPKASGSPGPAYSPETSAVLKKVPEGDGKAGEDMKLLSPGISPLILSQPRGGQMKIVSPEEHRDVEKGAEPVFGAMPTKLKTLGPASSSDRRLKQVSEETGTETRASEKSAPEMPLLMETGKGKTTVSRGVQKAPLSLKATGTLRLPDRNLAYPREGRAARSMETSEKYDTMLVNIYNKFYKKR